MKKMYSFHTPTNIIILLIFVILVVCCYHQSIQLKQYRTEIDARFQSSMNAVYTLLCSNPDVPDNSVDTDSIHHIGMCKALISLSSYDDHEYLQKSLTILQILAQNGHFSVLYSYPALIDNLGRMISSSYPAELEEEICQTLQEIEEIYLK